MGLQICEPKLDPFYNGNVHYKMEGDYYDFYIFFRSLTYHSVNCTSRFDRICVKNLKRGQSVTLCISRTTTPSAIPQGKHVTTEYQSEWSQIVIDTDGSLIRRTDSQNIVNNSCYTIKELQGDMGVFFGANVHPDDDITVQGNEVLQYPFNAFTSYEDHPDIAIIFYVATEGMHVGLHVHVYCVQQSIQKDLCACVLIAVWHTGTH